MIPEKLVNILLSCLYGIITGTLPAYYLCARCKWNEFTFQESIVSLHDRFKQLHIQTPDFIKLIGLYESWARYRARDMSVYIPQRDMSVYTLSDQKLARLFLIDYKIWVVYALMVYMFNSEYHRARKKCSSDQTWAGCLILTVPSLWRDG